MAQPTLIVKVYALMFWLAACSTGLLVFWSQDLILYGEYNGQPTAVGFIIITVMCLGVVGMIISGILLWFRRRLGRIVAIPAAAFSMFLAVPYMDLDHLLSLRTLLGLAQFVVFAVLVVLLTVNKDIKATLSS